MKENGKIKEKPIPPDEGSSGGKKEKKMTKSKQDTKKRGQNQGVDRVEGTRSLLVSEGDVGIFMRYLRKSGIIPTLTVSPHRYNIFATFHHHYTLYTGDKEKFHKNYTRIHNSFQFII